MNAISTQHYLQKIIKEFLYLVIQVPQKQDIVVEIRLICRLTIFEMRGRCGVEILRKASLKLPPSTLLSKFLDATPPGTTRNKSVDLSQIAGLIKSKAHSIQQLISQAQ